MAKEAHRQDRKPPPQQWGDLGAAFQRAGVPLNIAVAEAFDPLALELPLQGGAGAAPSALEARRRTAAFIRELYDDVFDYGLEGEGGTGEIAEVGGEPPEIQNPAPAALEVQAFDRKTGVPIKVKVKVKA